MTPPATRPARRRAWLVALAAAAVAVGLVGAAPAEALTIRRTWSATIGTAGAGGSARIEGYTTGKGRIVARLAGLPAGSRWSVQLQRGRCAAGGTRIGTVGAVTATSAGTAALNRALTIGTMNAVWKATWDFHTVSLRIAAGGTVRCADFGFATATRVAVDGLGIDLPVKEGPRSGLPCDVAFYIRELAQPGEPGATLLYAHARSGMFLPLLTASRISNGASLIGRTVRVWTSASTMYTYRISSVKRFQRSIASAFDVRGRVLWLQTSEGPYASSTKLVVVATQVGGAVPATWAAAHPTPRPVSC